MADKKIDVYLDTTRNPQVQVDPIVLGRSKMEWRRESDSPDFDFVNIDFDPSGAFTLKDIKPQKIEVSNSLAVGDYEYTLTVRSAANGDLYSTTESGPPAPGDRPVIRN